MKYINSNFNYGVNVSIIRNGKSFKIVNPKYLFSPLMSTMRIGKEIDFYAHGIIRAGAQ